MIGVPEAGMDQETFSSFVESTTRLLDDNFNDIMAVAYGQGAVTSLEEDEETDVKEDGEETSE